MNKKIEKSVVKSYSNHNAYEFHFYFRTNENSYTEEFKRIWNGLATTKNSSVDRIIFLHTYKDNKLNGIKISLNYLN